MFGTYQFSLPSPDFKGAPHNAGSEAVICVHVLAGREQPPLISRRLGGALLVRHR